MDRVSAPIAAERLVPTPSAVEFEPLSAYQLLAGNERPTRVAPPRPALSPEQVRALWISTALLMVVVAGWIRHLTPLTMNADEIWSVWQSFGSLSDVIRWTPTDWPPTYYVSIWAWKGLVGYTPEALRMLSLFTMLIGITVLSRAATAIWDRRVGQFTILVFGALGFAIFLSLLLRAYALLILFSALVLWGTHRYFTKPTLLRAGILAASAVMLFFVHFTGIGAIGAIGLFALVRYRQRIWRAWLPATMTIPLPALYIALNWKTFSERTGFNALQPLPPLLQALGEKLRSFGGPDAYGWLALLALASVGIVLGIRRLPVGVKRQRYRAGALGLFLWCSILIIIYLLNSRLGIFQDSRYLWWVLPGWVLWAALGLAALPQLLRRGASVSLVGMLFFSGSIEFYHGTEFKSYAHISLGSTFISLAPMLQPGDVVLVDPNNRCGPVEAWDYYQRLYFPSGLQYISPAQLSTQRRVWYVTADWLQVPDLFAKVRSGRVASDYIGPTECLFRLYMAPPDPTGILFSNGIRFHGAEIKGVATYQGVVHHEGEIVRVRLWWSATGPIARDYSSNLYAETDEGVVEDNRPPSPIGGPDRTSQWQANRYYIEERTLQLPAQMRPQEVILKLILYQWWDGYRVVPVGQDDAVMKLGTVSVHAW